MEEQKIGAYKVLKRAGAGGMAKVYLAVHQDVPNLKVILKILDDPRLGDRFRQEADKLALLDEHPNICRIKHFFNHGEDTVIAMEYIDGVTLDDRIKKEGTIPVDDAVRISCDVLDTLGFAHAKGVFHRDIKPGNIMIDKKGTVKVIDFGIAKSETDPNLTVAGTACGTPAYMSPEQFNPSAETDYSLVDVYAVGTTLFVMLTGKAPFEGDNPFAIRDLKLFNDPPTPRETNSMIPKDLDAVIAKSMAKDPADRYRSAEEMIAALAPFHTGGATPVHTPPPAVSTDDDSDKTIATPPPATPSTGKPGKSKKPLLIGAGILAVLAIVVMAFMFSGSGDDPTELVDPGETPEEPVTELVSSTGQLNLGITPIGDIYVDDSLVGGSTKSVSLTTDTGLHIVKFVNLKAKVTTLVDTLYVFPDQTTSRDYAFEIPTEPTPKPKPSKTYGKVIVGSKPRRGADIFVDGSQIEGKLTPYTIEKLESGRHTFRVRLGDITADSTITVKAGQTHKIIFDLDL